jgi:hypothetical protein
LVARWHFNPLTSLEKATALIVGWPIFMTKLEGGDVARTPLELMALFCAWHPTVCSPSPETGAEAVRDGYQAAGPESTRQAIPATPEGPAAAVAVTYCVPAVEGASLGPASDKVVGWLST